jgi:archaeosine-15-forming tRNA-guanine transglycosylase
MLLVCRRRLPCILGTHLGVDTSKGYQTEAASKERRGKYNIIVDRRDLLLAMGKETLCALFIKLELESLDN